MKYEVKYRIEEPAYSNERFPYLEIKYRRIQSEKIFANWTYLEIVNLDQRAKDLGICKYDASLSFRCYSYDQRVSYFHEVLKEKYDGRLIQYVEECAKVMIYENELKMRHDAKMNDIVSGWVTNGWEKIQIEIPVENG